MSAALELAFLRAQLYGQKLRRRACARRRRYARIGFTPELEEALRGLQRGRCALCRRCISRRWSGTERGEHADHCHASHRPRGFLCRACNLALGTYEAH